MGYSSERFLPNFALSSGIYSNPPKDKSNWSRSKSRSSLAKSTGPCLMYHHRVGICFFRYVENLDLRR
ncbi:uncharacterized protein L3040_003808 [Drepanopeziza brunnea f. sp. 'multigermtubi']|uniref:uncharacterized protein n=1 Tax=Drepanopeziza brunnea f. sp. 'multigermtubi' TaxID=698441 RepID=UPI00238EADA0|nr:hypothetical protein L3040_003808 [Drepanopeziza brunnea f. sp. 'multigermtubi']